MKNLTFIVLVCICGNVMAQDCDYEKGTANLKMSKLETIHDTEYEQVDLSVARYKNEYRALVFVIVSGDIQYVSQNHSFTFKFSDQYIKTKGMTNAFGELNSKGSWMTWVYIKLTDELTQNLEKGILQGIIYNDMIKDYDFEFTDEEEVNDMIVNALECVQLDD